MKIETQWIVKRKTNLLLETVFLLFMLSIISIVSPTKYYIGLTTMLIGIHLMLFYSWEPFDYQIKDLR